MDNLTNTQMIHAYEAIARVNRKDDWPVFLEEAKAEPWQIAYEVEECSPMPMNEFGTPFKVSALDERMESLVQDVIAWIDRRIAALTEPVTPEVMTVGEIIDALFKYPHDMPVLMDDGDGWYTYISRMDGPHVPDDGEESPDFMRPTFAQGRCWDARDA